MLIDVREGKGGRRDVEKDGCEKETSIGCLLHARQPGTEPIT